MEVKLEASKKVEPRLNETEINTQITLVQPPRNDGHGAVARFLGMVLNRLVMPALTSSSGSFKNEISLGWCSLEL